MKDILRLIEETKRNLYILEKMIRDKSPKEEEQTCALSASGTSEGHGGLCEYDPVCISCPLWQDGFCDNTQKDSCLLSHKR